MRLARYTWLGLAALPLTAYAHRPAPQARLEAAQASARTAEAVGAAQVPQADLYLRLSKDEVQQAEALMREGKEARADGLLQRAEADAELATATARSEQARHQADLAQARVHALRKAGLAAP
jgi:hypothetical protein